MGKIGWHTFRHTFSTLVHSIGTDWLCGRSFCGTPTSRQRWNIYTQAVAPAERRAIRKLTKKLLEG